VERPGQERRRQHSRGRQHRIDDYFDCGLCVFQHC
jgi:hypothetical protein